MAALDIIYVKTAKGDEEIQSRAHRLPARMRVLLFMIDGVSPAREWVEKASLLGNGEDLLNKLLVQGFIKDSRDNGMLPAITRQAPPPAKKPSALPPSPAETPPDLTKRLSEAKSIMRYCVRNCAGFSDSRTLNKMLDQAHDKNELLGCLNAIAEKLDNGPQSAMVGKIREQVTVLLM
jgi:hypothetical protein